MSLINSMLRELDARQPGAASGAAADAQVRTVPARRRRHPVRLSALVAALIAAGGFAGWQLTRPEAPRMATSTTRLKAPATVQASAAPASPASPATPATLAAAPAAQAAPPAAVAEPGHAAQALPAAQPAATSQPAVAAQTPAAASSLAATPLATAAPPVHASQPLAAVQPARAAPRDKPKAPDLNAMRAAATPSAPAHTSAAQTPAAHPVATQTMPEVSHPAARVVPAPERNIAKRESTAAQRENGDDADALAEPADMPQSIEGLQRLLREQPRNAKLQTALVGALTDAGRSDEAMRIAREALAQDATQSTLAMTLARLQVEHGELQAAIRTLEKSQAYGGERADYQAFLAALLQRGEQHQEAAQHYRAALTKSPQTGVWWLGLGISLQALQRDADALEAFRRAKTAGGLNPELLAFVNGRIEQLGR